MEWRTVNERDPCEICGRADWCRRADGVRLCRRVSFHPTFGRARSKVDQNGQPYQLFFDRRSRGTANSPPRQDPKPRPDIGPLARQLADNLTGELRIRLCERLGLPPWAGEGIALTGWQPREGKYRAASRTFPERDGCGRIVGLATRELVSGRKKRAPGSHAGCVMPAAWPPKRDSWVLGAEGASDVLAGAAAGLCVVGRPSNLAGAGDLAGIVGGLPRPVRMLIVGENDQKDTSYDQPEMRWPGRLGAYQAACTVARLLNEPVQWALTPDGHKDIRAWLIDRAAGNTDRDHWRRCGAVLLSKLVAAAETVYPDFQGWVPAEEPRCQSSFRIRLSGCGERTVGKRATIEVPCRSWRCDQCRVFLRNLWLYSLATGIGSVCAQFHFPGELGEPFPNLYRQAGPWKLGAAIITRGRWPTLRRALNRVERFDHPEQQWATVEISDIQTTFRYLSQLVIEDSTPSMTNWDTSGTFRRLLVVAAVSPTAELPAPLVPVPACRVMPVLQATLDGLRVPPLGPKERWRPVGASPGWRPQEDPETSGNWAREGGSRFTPRATRRVLDLVRAQAEDNRPMSRTILDSVAWPENDTGRPFLSWLLHRLTDPSVATQATTEEEVARRFDLWAKLVRPCPIPIPRTWLTEEAVLDALSRDPLPADLDRLVEAAELTAEVADLGPIDESAVAALFKSQPPQPPPVKRRRTRRTKPPKHAPPNRELDRVKDTIGR